MKIKRIIIVLLAVGILIGGLSGYAYAATQHQVVKDNKIVGFAPYGTSENGQQVFDAVFVYSNPDCERNITIKQISIIRADGVVVYETYPDAPLEPHQTRIINLSNFGIPAPSSLPDQGTIRFYTVEISWQAKSRCLPLSGTVAVLQYSDFDGDGIPTLSKTRINMFNY